MIAEAVQELNKVKIPCKVLDFANLIMIYDNDLYSSSDYDFVDNEHRTMIRRILQKHGWKTTSSRIFTKDGVEIMFPKPGFTLGQDPSEMIINEIKENRYIFATPTQALLIAMRKDQWNQEEFEALSYKFPMNIAKIKNWKDQYQIKSPSHGDLNQIAEIQKTEFLKKVRK